MSDANFTPNLGEYKSLQPFRFWCQKVLPLVYDDSLSYYELLCKVVDYLNKTMEDVETLHGDVTNLHKAYVELQEYVNNYFNNLDVQEEINKKLDSMVDDGTLSNLLFNLPKFSTFSPTFKCRTYGLTESEYTHMQGGCVVNGLFVYAKTKNTPTDDYCIIEVIDPYNETIIRSVKVKAGHCDDICYNPITNCLYAVPYQHYDGSDWNSILVIDYPTLTVINEITTVIPIKGLGYDKVTNLFYAYDSSLIFYEYDIENNTVKNLFTYNQIDSNKFVKQTLAAHAGKLYLTTAYPNNIFCISITGKTLSVMNFPLTNVENYMYGELECCDIFENVLTIGSAIRTPSSKYELACVWSTNILNGEADKLRAGYDAISTLHLDANYTGLRPTGSETRPFPTLDEAMLYNIKRRTIEPLDGDYDGQVFDFCRIICKTNNINLNINTRTGFCSISGAKSVSGNVYKGSTLELLECGGAGHIYNEGNIRSDTLLTNVSGSGSIEPLASSIKFNGNTGGFVRCVTDRSDLAKYIKAGNAGKLIVFNGIKGGKNYSKIVALSYDNVISLKGGNDVIVSCDGEDLTISISNNTFTTTPAYSLQNCFIYC